MYLSTVVTSLTGGVVILNVILKNGKRKGVKLSFQQLRCQTDETQSKTGKTEGLKLSFPLTTLQISSGQYLWMFFVKYKCVVITTKDPSNNRTNNNCNLIKPKSLLVGIFLHKLLIVVLN
jgi:hypothetical protein